MKSITGHFSAIDAELGLGGPGKTNAEVLAAEDAEMTRNLLNRCRVRDRYRWRSVT
ncbi:MAG: hypothetical protein MK080_00235 [Opitutales bacterium]|nr:hypothetical protein [Opitutales bacterium]NRA25750.1 hypothetical protein [Opitutales bacterium]